ncbi:MAG: type II toxin-antitoxin system VapC family toxin, partial [Saprospiraceae bacterium]
MTDLLLDTNIFIYAYDSSSPFHLRSAALFNSQQLRLFTTTKNITECVAVMTKLEYPKAHIEQLLEDISNNIVILYPSAVSLQIFGSLFKKYAPRGNRVFDLEVAAVMLANGVLDIATI